ncbi:MMPL family transporter [Marinibactrum halimedae]|uniref:Membrane protein n=1 Tax=Marinibactrum halimedae TaxID=1444977 RepID=A0AA37T856_9GAMM|nr:MMPL family transporter [Marinibactrum halimedae]MCD9460440.1 MMPL family transporter [Marinibactrum halimedae]GLS27429.1 membrane protein [Marinibactrum halimedae]
MENIKPVIKASRALFIAYSLLLFFAVIVQTPSGFHLNSNFTELAPRDAQTEIVSQAQSQVHSLIGDSVLLAVLNEDDLEVRKAALSLASWVDKNQYWHVSPGPVDETHIERYLSVAIEHRYRFLSHQMRISLSEEGGAGQVREQALMRLFQPGGSNQALPFVEDPYNLWGNWLEETLVQGNLEQQDNVFYGNNKGTHFALLFLTPSVDLAPLSLTRAAVDQLNGRLVEFSNVEVFKSGLIFHTHEAAKQAQKEISLIASGSLLAIIVLFILVFRSTVPLCMAFFSIGFGVLAGFILTHWLFGQIHMIALVFGASLIGVSVDYALHFLCRLYLSDEQSDGQSVDGPSALKSVFKGISLALFSSVIGYFCLVQSGMIGLYQIAIFSMVGLISAWLFVVVFYPLLSPSSNQSRVWPSVITEVIIQRYKAVLKSRIAMILLVTCALGTIVHGMLSFNWSDDVRQLHTPSPELIHQAKKMGHLLTDIAPNQFFLVHGDSLQAMLQMDEHLSVALDEAVASEVLQGYRQISRYLPSEKRQKSNDELLAHTLYNESHAEFLQSVGVESDSIDEHLMQWRQTQETFIAPESVINVLPPHIASLWIGEVDSEWYCVVGLKGIRNTQALQDIALNMEGVEWVNTIDDLSSALLNNSQQAIRFLIIAYGVIGLILLLFYRSMVAIKIMIIPMLSSLLTISIISLLGHSITLFHAMGLFLVLGLGLDYAVFVNESTQRDGIPIRPDAFVAIYLSAITSMLSFGLMSLSSTPMVQAFGLVILIGGLANLLLAPLLGVMAAKGGAQRGVIYG